MLKGIPSILSPELLKVLMEMGHGDEICLADGNFPAASMGKRVVRLDGHGIEPILRAILDLFPLDTFVDKPVSLMQKVDNTEPEPIIWGRYRAVLESAPDASVFRGFEMVERFAFYERARNCFAVIATGESALYANIILKKGVVV